MTASSSRPEPGASWLLHHRVGTAGELHQLDLLGGPTVERGLWHMEVTRPAVVVGSVQGASGQLGLDPARLSGETDVVARRSGGGAVRLEPGNGVWLDVVIARCDPLWLDDISRSAMWLGRAWMEALETLGVHGTVHDGPADRHDHARAACFAGLGPGEVVDGERKLVGISQRRTRTGARFQCVAYTEMPAIDDVVAVVGGDDALAARLRQGTGVVSRDPGVLFGAVRRAIMSAGNDANSLIDHSACVCESANQTWEVR